MLDCRAQDAEIKDAALWAAGRVRSMVKNLGLSLIPADQLRQHLTAHAVNHQARPPCEKLPLDGIIARMSDGQWWTKNLRRELLKENEAVEHAAGLVRRKHQVYVTDHASKIKRLRAKANRATLEGLEVVNEDGQAFNLQELADTSISNPKLRRAELMMRCRGFEDAAAFMGHAGWFLTLTTPSRFHRVNHAGKANPKWAGATPKDGQIYLCGVWAKIRAAWKKAGVLVYGFRVAEPHHDGTPHWHALLFCPPGDKAAMLSIASRYALAESPNESGAKKHRFTAKFIDPTKGSATGYIAKYIAKNIDGEKETGDTIGLDFDSGTSAGDASRRVRDWASTWGIRQFQQVGGPSVTVWRELRRLGKDADALQLELFEKPRAAAVRSDWFAFWMLQGGPEVARQALTLKPFYVADDLGKYGDLVPKIKGIQGHDAGADYVEITRLATWTVQRAGAAAVDQWQADLSEARIFKTTNATFLQAYKDSEFKRIGEADQARTGINNCSEALFDFSSFDASNPDEYAHLDDRGDPGDPWDVMESVWAAEAHLEKINVGYAS